MDKPSRHHRRWTTEEDERLNDLVGIRKIKSIAQIMGRTEASIELRMHLLGINHTKEAYGKITINKLANILNKNWKTVDRWIKEKGLPCEKRITRGKARYFLIDTIEFWKWVEGHKDKLDYSKLKPNALPPEPDWVSKERSKLKGSKQKVWTDEEESKAKALRDMGYSITKIAQSLGRSYHSVSHKLSRIKYHERILLPWTDEEVETMLELEKQGMTDEEIAWELGRDDFNISDKRRNMRIKGLYDGNKKGYRYKRA